MTLYFVYIQSILYLIYWTKHASGPRSASLQSYPALHEKSLVTAELVFHYVYDVLLLGTLPQDRANVLMVLDSYLYELFSTYHAIVSH